MNVLLLILLLLGKFLFVFSGEGVTYCVIPTPDTTCSPSDDCQQCETLQFYCEHVDTTINQQKNVTVTFMKGNHTAYIKYRVTITAPIIVRSIGNGQNIRMRVVSLCDDCNLVFNSTSVSIQNLRITDSSAIINIVHAKKVKLEDSTFQSCLVNITQALEVMLDNCTFFDDRIGTNIIQASKVLLKNCTFQDLNRNGIVFRGKIAVTKIELRDCFVCNATITVHANNVLDRNEMLLCSVLIGGDSAFISGGTITAINCLLLLSGNVTFANSTVRGPIHVFQAGIKIKANANVVFANNSIRGKGGAMYLYYSSLNIESGVNVTFINNSASDKGGAIYIAPGIDDDSLILNDESTCFFTLWNCNNTRVPYISFINNSAEYGGDDIFGASLYTCYREKQCNFNITVINPGSISAVSSDPLRVCICDSYGVPQCSDIVTHINSQTVHPGESFSVPAAIVGFDTQSGATTGTVYADFLPTENSTNMKLYSNTHVINNSKRCTNLEYAVFANTVSNNTSVMIYINTVDLRAKRLSVTHPVYINITLLPCPPGFSLRNQSCDCYLHHELYDDCHIIDRKGYFLWSKKIWVNIYKVSGGILYNTHCPYDYCYITDSWINLQNDANSQCSFNRGGRLCGGCKENYSLAIGSSHCIHCPNNNNLALLIFFAAAGFLLVFFISAFNLTVTQGMINGFIFYANIVWFYQSIFFPQELKTITIIKLLKTFIAWINLDFGIETCFISGLTAFWKIWLQFIFPFYIWAVAGLIIVATRYSTRLTNLFGNKAVPVLNTLFLLSYMKLSRIVAAVIIFSTIRGYPQTNTDSVVWSVDGNLSYFGFPHIWLFLAGLATLLFLWLPFTLLLLLM